MIVREAALCAPGPIDLRLQAEFASELRANMPTQLALVDVAEADWRKSSSCRVGRTDARNGHHLRTHVDGTDARRAE